MLHRHFHTSAALLCLLAAGSAQADVTFARRGKIACVIEITDKAPNTTFHIWQSTEAGGETYEDTGHTIRAGADGSGKKTIALNDDGTLMLGHNVTIGNAAGRDTNQVPHVVEHPEPMRSPVQSGFNAPEDMILSQAFQTGTDIFLETWKPNTMYSLMLNPAEAVWLNIGCSIHGQGDLQVQLLQITPQNIVFRVIGDPSMNTLDNVIISGVGMQVLSPPCGSVGITLGFQGSTDVYYNGEFLQNFAGSGQSEYDRLALISPADFNQDGTIDFFDYLDFVDAFSSSDPTADFNKDGVIDFFDYLDFVDAFSTGC